MRNFCHSVGEINRAKGCSGHCVLQARDKPNGDSFIHCTPELERSTWHLTKRVLEQLKINAVQYSANTNFTAYGGGKKRKNETHFHWCSCCNFRAKQWDRLKTQLHRGVEWNVCVCLIYNICYNVFRNTLPVVFILAHITSFQILFTMTLRNTRFFHNIKAI